MAKYRDTTRVLCCYLVVVLYCFHSVGEVLCDDQLKAEKFVDPIERSNAMQLVENRSENTRSDKFAHQPVKESVLNEIREAAEQILSKKCRDDIALIVDGIRWHQHWALQMYDASVKEPSGVEYGDTFQFGNFDECLNVFRQRRLRIERDTPRTQSFTTKDEPTFNPQYCLADVTLQGYAIGEMSSRNHHVQNVTATQIAWGLCLPDSCLPADAAGFLASATGHKVSVRPEMCTGEARETPMSAMELLFVCAIGGFVSIVLFCTFYKAHLMGRREGTKRNRPSTGEELIGAFSLTENLKKLTCVGSDDLGLSCLNGIKAIAMLLIVSGHSLIFVIGGPVKNSDFYEKQAKLVQNAFLLNSPLLVDTFLLLSGLLFARLLMLELEKRKGRVNFGLLYIFRYIRLTPAYLAIIALYSTILPRLGSGPVWNYRIGLEQDRCLSSWWMNLLYINNYVGTDKLCMFQSWYLSADTQLFILAPLILYPLWRWRRAGMGLLAAVTIVSTLIPLVVTYVKKIDPTFLVFADEISDLGTNDYFTNMYIKTHMRATAYVFGLLTGYLIHVMQEKSIILSKRTQAALWTVALVGGLGSMFSVTIFYHPEYKYSTLESAVYAGLHRLGWSFFTGWIVLACVTGYAGRMRRFFAARALVPFSRLTYCAYLTNGLVELYHASSIRTSKYLNIMNLTSGTLGHVALTFLAALVLCLLFESPIHGIEKILLRRDSQKRRSTSEADQLNSSPSTSSSEESIR